MTLASALCPLLPHAWLPATHPATPAVSHPSLHRIEYNEVNLDQLGGFPAESEVNPTTLAEARLLRKLHNPVVILGRGNVEVPLKVRVQRVSKSAQAKIEAAGGSVEIVE